MSQATPKIVVLKEGTDAMDFAASSLDSPQVVDAHKIMQTDYMPGAQTAPANRDGGFFSCEISDSKARELESQPEVEAVVDDIEVFAYPNDLDEDVVLIDDQIDEEMGNLEIDPNDVEDLEAGAFPTWSADDENELITDQELLLASQNENDVLETADLEVQLMGEALDASLQDLEIDIADEQDTRMRTAIIRSLESLIRERGLDALREDELETALQSAGLDVSTARLLRDFLLWNIRMVYANYAWRYSTGYGARVAVIDTGIDPSHPDLRVRGGVSYVPGVSSWRDDHYHGTHVAGTIAARLNRRGIAGVAPNVSLYAVKVLNRNGSGRLSWILNGLMWCYRARMHVCNLSLGSRERTHDPRVYNRAYEHVGRILRRRGILCVAAAGNSNEPVGNPARCPSFLAVSAIDRRARKASFSCFGPQVELAAPGVGVVSTIPGGRYRALNGTSMACPHVAGVAALVKARNRTWHGDRVRVHLWRTAIDIGRPNRDPIFGFGLVNAYRAVR